MLVKPDVALLQVEFECKPSALPVPDPDLRYPTSGHATTPHPHPQPPQPSLQSPQRFHGTVQLDSTHVGRDAARIADEVNSHLAGMVGAKVQVTLEIEAQVPGGVPDQVVRIVTENSRTLKFINHGFEQT